MVLRWLTGWRNWFGYSSPPAKTICRIVFYTRQGCHLCEAALEHLEAARRRYAFVLEVIDVDADFTLRSQHGDWVPVVKVNDKVRFRGGMNPVLLGRLLAAEAERSADR